MNSLNQYEDLTQKKIRECRIPSLGMGTYGLEGKECYEAVIDAIELGYRHIDTAQAYGNEKEVGMGIKESGIQRNEIFLTDKIWWDKLKSDQVKKSFDESLKKLNTNYVDLLLIHWPSPNNVSLQDTLKAMHDLKRAGKVKFIGVSNFTNSLMKSALALEDVICNQVEYHPFFSQEDLIELAIAHSFFIIAYSPLAQGDVTKHEMLRSIGTKYGKSASQVALRWLIQHHLVVAIPRTSSQKHRKANFNIFDFELAEHEMKTISALTAANKRMIDPKFAPNWN